MKNDIFFYSKWQSDLPIKELTQDQAKSISKLKYRYIYSKHDGASEVSKPVNFLVDIDENVNE